MKKLVFTFKRIDHPAQDLAVKFHGFLMEQLDSDYVDYLHQQQTNPYATKVIQGKKTRSGLYICSQMTSRIRFL